jgi:hypothetical protein
MAAGGARPWKRLVSISRTGRFVALRGSAAASGSSGASAIASIDLVDAIGTAPRHSLPGEGVLDFACIGQALWLLEAHALRRITLEGARPIPPDHELRAAATGLAALVGDHAQAALVYGARPQLISGQGDRVTADDVTLTDDERAFPLQGRRLAIAGARGLRFVEGSRGEVGRALMFEGAKIQGAAALFGGRALAVLTRDDDRDLYWVLRPDGSLIHKVAIPRLSLWAVAETRGLALGGGEDGTLIEIDLRYGRVLAVATPPSPVFDLDLDADGQFLVLAGQPDALGAASVLHLPATDVFSAGSAARASLPSMGRVVSPAQAEAGAQEAAPSHDEDKDKDEDDAPEAPQSRRSGAPDQARPDSFDETHLGQKLSAVHAPVAVDAAQGPGEDVTAPAPEPVVIPELLPMAFGEPLPALTARPHPEWPPYASEREHLDELLDVVAARASKAISDAWNSGRLSAPAEDARPFEREVRALLGHVGGYAADMVGESDARLASVAARSAGRARSSIAAGLRLPFVELSREFQLSSTAAHVLMVAIAPMIRGEVARLFGILGNDENRPMVDRYLVELLIAGHDPQARLEVARELADDAPLLRYGLLRISGGDRGAGLFGAITVDTVLIERLRGRVSAPVVGDVATIQYADRTLDELHVPAQIKRDLVLTLAARRSDEDQVRLVLLGRRGSGRHSLVAALAARVGRGITRIDCSRMPRNGKAMASVLSQEMFRALLRGCVPVVSGLDVADPADPEGQEMLKQALRAHPGPLVIRAAPEATLPLEPGFVTAQLPPLSEGERAEFWRGAVARAGLPVADPDMLAARYRVGPGVIEHVVAQAVAQRVHEQVNPEDDAGKQLEQVAAQHIATRLTHIASRVKRLPRWEQVALPGDIIDSIREFVARISQRKTVYDTWGFDEKMSTSRGLTALFYGPPGTGKTMVAGLIARELGLELYRIDLARIVSKWIGETEKNLAEVFDAAEDGQVVIVFDEADSLFAKRTEVKSSVDRYANLEVNYLLQRLDSFEGIAILTTNLEGSIDTAFKRRMSLRLQFPFPDEEMRVRLWASHIPSEVPVQGDFDFAELARRFPLSGGYIRNSTLRAAFLAAQEQRPMGQEHLLRAIALEYRELGKLSTSGRME